MALDDVEHVEAIAIIRGLAEEWPLPAHESLVRAAEAWCDAHRPEPSAYMAAMRAMADGTFHRLL